MRHWYDQAIIYQIYPKSFQDSNSDGIGDLNGIRKRIPYLKELGINAVWLNPIFVSPQVDNGYDVSNYFAIDPKMGTMEDMDNLIKEMHEAGIHVIMDFVLNHTSDQHPWFQDAIKNPESIYRDYYIFAGENNQRPNNWGSFFGGSVWEKDPAGTGQFYFHLFDKRMPDLNWKNPEVRHAMTEIAKYWLEKGIDGLRLDAFIHIAKADLRQNFPVNSKDEEPVIAEPFFANLPQVQKWMRPFCEEIKQDYPDALLLGEAASANVNLAVDYTNKDNHLMDSVITFRYFTEDQSKIDPSFLSNYQPKQLDWVKFKQNQTIWQQTLSGISKPTLYWNNHDMARLATRIAKNDTQARSLAMLMYLQCGIPIIYYGEELGMRNLQFENVNDFQDDTVKEFVKSAEKAGVTSKEALLMASKTHKLPARGPMPWDNERNNGFTDKEPWIKGKKLDETNAADEIADDSSMFNFYKKLISLKKEQLFQDGNYYLWSTSDGSYVYERNLKDKKALIAVSLSQEPIEIEVGKEFSSERLSAGEYDLTAGKLRLEPYAGVVLEN
ncbi:glucohydrolase [Lactobacillus johnsonii]|uniref:Alpha-glucosidase n=1 Tax=Lactobacillus johnsonii TaxID=33959 RepID=A0A267ME76_LACJH|nr:alpha-glucosidase [Lactobacillus johnsonii]PAB57175.1 glucohydrolase [Lactobacillus johnsonii]PAB57789.1 glucohydrolase [Lactobacillus johnsonii]PEG67858.1 alpha-glucosidase [Lactobacillus johnsonii]PEG70139.1 alpha-glucosidase [Lactobacillus johnsonii]HJE49128.1 alpha-glucosidase [Lactobacillus johnsonii]